MVIAFSLLKLLAGAISKPDRIARVKDDDDDPGMGSWIPGIQSRPSAGITSVTGLVTGLTAKGNDYVANAIDHVTSSLDPSAWLTGIEHWIGGWWTALATWATGAGFPILAGLIGVVAARWLVGMFVGGSRSYGTVSQTAYTVPVVMLGMLARQGIKYQIVQQMGDQVAIQVPIYHSGRMARMGFVYDRVAAG